MRDIYDPPPSPPSEDRVPPKVEPLAYTSGDLACLIGLVAALLAASAWAWSFDATLGVAVTVGGIFVILESWFSAVTFLHRHPSDRPGARWVIVLAALVPWTIALGFAVALMLVLFALSDWIHA